MSGGVARLPVFPAPGGGHSNRKESMIVSIPETFASVGLVLLGVAVFFGGLALLRRL